MFSSRLRIAPVALCVLLLSGCGPGAPSKRGVAPVRAAVETVHVADARSNPDPEPVVLAAKDKPPVAPQIVYRPDDKRPHHDDAKLAAIGILKFESKRLRLYTDLDAELASPLPALIDRAYTAMVEYFGQLPPARDGSEFQMTGYLMRDEALFREAGLIPADLPPFKQGRHRRNEFWVRDQEYDYYRRHLVIHEATHSVTTYMPDTNAPVWYLEGIAEVFGTHRIDKDGRFEWGVMPDSPENFPGLGRIKLIRDLYAQGKGLSIPQIMSFRPEDYLENPPYAWSWALCHFLARHPRYRDRFREMGHCLQGSQFAPALTERFAQDARDLATEWALFTVNLQNGYDMERSAISFEEGTPLGNGEVRELDVLADRGWQSSRLSLQAGSEYEVTASGQFTLADQPRPWLSEPQGVSIRYFDGSPLGELQGCIRHENASPGEEQSMLKVLSIGRGKTFTAPVTGTLYLRLNDAWSELADNRGQVHITVRLR